MQDLRESYDRVADRYVEMSIGDLRPHPWLRAALDAFGEQVHGPVLDVGCGPGQVTAYLAHRGVDVSGVDLSPRMIDHARRTFPSLAFEVADATALALPDESLGGVLGWWSLFNLPRDVFAQVVRAFFAALRPGGSILIGTHVGDGEIVRTEAYGGVPVRWTTHLWQPEQLAAVITAAGFVDLVEMRFPPDRSSRPQVLICGRRPD